MRAYRLALLAAVSFSLTARAQSGPEDVVRAFLAAQSEGRWLDAARLLDLRHFERFRMLTIRGWETQPRIPQPTPEKLMQADPNMPQTVAEYEAKQAAEQMRNFNWLEHEFARVTSIDTLRALSTEAAAARWLEAKNISYMTQLASRESKSRPRCESIPDSIKKKLNNRSASGEYEPPKPLVLGSTSNSDSVRYVVVGQRNPLRRTVIADYAEAAPVMSPRVVTVRNIDANWRIVPAYDLPNAEGYDTVFLSIDCNDTTSATAKKH